MGLRPIRNKEEYSEFVRNYVGNSLSRDTLESFRDEIGKSSVTESKPGTVMGEFLLNTLKVKGVTYAPRMIKRGAAEVWFNFATGVVSYSDAEGFEDRNDLNWGELYPWVVIGRILEALGVMEYNPVFTGAEAQDYSQTDSDVEPERTIGYKTE